MKNSKIIIGLLLLSLGLLIGQSITFNVTNFEGGPASGVEASWMFDADWTPFVYDNDATSQYAYVGLRWNPDGHGNGSCEVGDQNQGSGAMTSSIATDEDFLLLEGIDDVMLFIDGFDLTHFEHINTVNSEGAWDTFGEAGDYRIYDNGVGEIWVSGEIKLKANSVVFYTTTHYPTPIGNGGLTGYATIIGQGNIIVEESDPDWVAELDPNNTGLVSFESSSMSPTIQLCYGAYNTNLLVKTMDSEDTSPTAEFSADITNGEEPLTVNFSDLSVVGNSDITSWFWDFGDDGTSVEQNPEYTYGSAGVYTVSLTITDENGFSDIETKVDYITVTSPLEETYFNFDYSGVSINGAFSVSGTFDPLNLPSDGTSGYYETGEDTVTAMFSGIEAVMMDSVNIAGISMETLGELVPGVYPIDSANLSTVFGFAVGVSLTEFPTDFEDLMDNIADLDAEAIYISASGTVTVTEITPTTVSGEFSGVMVNLANPADMLEVAGGEFSVDANLVQYTMYPDGNYSFHYFGSNMSGEYNVSGVLNPLEPGESGVLGFIEFSEDTTTAVFAGVEVVENGGVDSLNLGMVYLHTPGELVEGPYSIDVLNGNVLFGLVLGVDVLNLEDYEEMEADAIYVSGTGIITISTITDSTLSGTFSGLVFNIENPVDMISVTNGNFFMSKDVLLGTGYSDVVVKLPTEFVLQQNYPNPFNPMTTIEYEIQKSGFVNLSVFDIQGREVSSLVNGYQSLGWHTINWDGSGFSSGIYLYRLTMDNEIITRKMLLTK